MKKLIAFITLSLFFSCQMFEIPLTPEEVELGYGKPASYYEFPTERAFEVPDMPDVGFIVSNATNGIFGTNELLNLDNVIMPEWGDRNTITNAKTFSILEELEDQTETIYDYSAEAYPEYLRSLFYFWADASWGFGNNQIDGGDHKGDYVEPVVGGVHVRNRVVQMMFLSEIFEEAGYIEASMLALYYGVVQSYRLYQQEGAVVTVYAGNIDGIETQWIITDVVFSSLEQFFIRYGDELGFTWEGWEYEGIGEPGPAYPYDEYNIEPGYFQVK